MKNTVKRIVIILAVVLLILGGIQQPTKAELGEDDEIQMIESGMDGLVLEVKVDWDQVRLDEHQIDGDIWTAVVLKDRQKITVAGAPALPYFSTSLGVPIGAGIEVSVSPGQTHYLPVSYPVEPALSMEITPGLPDAITGNPGVPQYTYVLKQDSSVYNQSGQYPGKLAEISNDGMIRQQRVVGLAIYPIQYDLIEQRLILYDTLIVTIRFTDTVDIERGSIVQDALMFETFFSETLLNYQEAKDWRLDRSELRTGALLGGDAETSYLINDRWSPPNDTWRIATGASGIYMLDHAQLNAAGVLASDPDPLNFQMFYQGVEIAIEVTGAEDHSFDDGDLVLFYGEEKTSKYSDENIYWFVTGDVPGLRVTARDVTPGTAVFAESYLAKAHFEEVTNFYLYLPLFPGDDDTERLLWEYLYPPSKPSWTYDFLLVEPATGSAQLTVSMMGYLDNALNLDHHVEVYINDVKVGETYWDGLTRNDFTVTIPSGLLRAGSNTITLHDPNDLGVGVDIVYIDWMELEYPNTFTAEGNFLQFSYILDGPMGFQISGYTEDVINLYDVTDPYTPVKLTGMSVHGVSPDFSLQFEDDASTKFSFICLSPSAYKEVISITADNPSDLMNVENSAQYIIISHKDFWDQALVLANYRNSQGLSTMLVDVQDIYDEFGFGVVGVKPIHDFLLYALTQWKAPAPAYVLLIGDGHFDPENYLGYGRTSYIPPFLAMADPWRGETAADNRYVTLVGDDLMPDMIIGRMAVNTVAEAAVMVNKVINYEADLNPGDWQHDFLVIADEADPSGNFPFISDNLLSDLLPSAYSTSKVYLGITHTTGGEANTAIIAEINEGAVIVNYTGHGYYGGWSDAYILTTDHISSLLNSEKLPIILSMTCADGFFQYPNPYSAKLEGLAESLTRSSLGGAVASWSATGDGLSTGHDQLDRGFLNAYFTGGATTIGEATLAGKLNLWNTGNELELLDMFTLFGDPTMQFHRMLMAMDDEYQTNEDEDLIVDVDQGVLKNDLNPGGSELTAELVSGPDNGLLLLSSDGSFSYSPDPDWFGFDGFSYKIYDGSQYSNSVMVDIEVYPVDDPPVALNQVVYTLRNLPVAIVLGAVDVDPGGAISLSNYLTQQVGIQESRGLSFEIVDSPLNGELSGTAPELLYTPHQDFIGSDIFTFRVNDGQDYSNLAAVTIFVRGEHTFYLPMIVK